MHLKTPDQGFLEFCNTSHSIVTHITGTQLWHIEKEGLALVYCVRKLDNYLRYASFTAIVDHSALKGLFSLNQPSGKFARWVTLLQSYSFEIEYRPGRNHQNADAISRREYETPSQEAVDIDDFVPLIGADFEFAPPKESSGEVASLQAGPLPRSPRHVHPSMQDQAQEISPDILLGFPRDEFQEAQRKDPSYAHMITYLTTGTLPTDSEMDTKVIRDSDNYFMHDDLLYHVSFYPGRGDRMSRSYVQLVIPRPVVPNVLREVHDSSLAGGHLGISRTMEKVRLKFYWQGMCADIVSYVKNCIKCNQRKSPVKKVRAQLCPMPVPTMPFERVSTDILGPLPTCDDTGHKYVLVFVDYFSKYIELIPVADIKAVTVARAFLREIVCRHGAPEYLHSDRGTNYLSNIVKFTCEFMGTKKTQTTSYHPQCNGQSERCMSYILAALSKHLDEYHNV